MKSEKLKIWLDFGKFFLGTFVLGLLGYYLKASYESREFAIKESDQIGKYIEIALRKDVGERKRFAEYFKTVSLTEEYRDRWEEYYQLVNSEYEAIEARVDSLERVKEKVKEENINSDSLSVETEMIIESLENEQEFLRDKLIVEKPMYLNDLPLQIGIHSLNPDKNKRDQIKRYLGENGFLITANGAYSTKPSWMASSNTVFYYSRHSKANAEKVATDLENLLDVKFSVRRGAGMGVAKGHEARTFFVHYLQD